MPFVRINLYHPYLRGVSKLRRKHNQRPTKTIVIYRKCQKMWQIIWYQYHIRLIWRGKEKKLYTLMKNCWWLVTTPGFVEKSWKTIGSWPYIYKNLKHRTINRFSISPSRPVTVPCMRCNIEVPCKVVSTSYNDGNESTVPASSQRLLRRASATTRKASAGR